VDKDDGGATGYQFLVDTDNTLSFSAVSGSSLVSSDASSITLNQWQHVVVTYDGSNARFFVNGVAKGAPVLTDVPSNTIHLFAIGNRATALNRGFDGLIDDVRIYSRALNQSEILSLYQSGSCIHESDSSCDGCVDTTELSTFIDRWKVSNQDVTLKELMEAIGFWKRGGCP